MFAKVTPGARIGGKPHTFGTGSALNDVRSRWPLRNNRERLGQPGLASTISLTRRIRLMTNMSRSYGVTSLTRFSSDVMPIGEAFVGSLGAVGASP